MSSESTEKFGGSKILIIASYNGPRRWSLSNSELLQYQKKHLDKYKHSLDKILVVQNQSDTFPDELNLFEHVLHRENLGGSYGAWLDGYQQNPNYDWYFFVEDDYVFTLDNFDQRMIDMWTDETTYLCSRAEDNGFGYHASISNGLTRGEILKSRDFGGLMNLPIYHTLLQVSFSNRFDPGVRDIREKYCSPFWSAGIKYIDEKPILLTPVQMLKEMNE